MTSKIQDGCTKQEDQWSCSSPERFAHCKLKGQMMIPRSLSSDLT